MKILMINDLLQGGGVEKLMHDLVMQFHDKYEITIFTKKKQDCFTELYPSNVQYMYEEEHDDTVGRSKLERRILAIEKLKREEHTRQIIKKKQFDVLLSMKEGWIMRMSISYGSSIPKRYAWVHTDYSQSYYTKDCFGSDTAELNCMQHFNKVICVSQVIKDSITKVLGDPGNLIVQYNPVDSNKIMELSKEHITDITKGIRPLFVSVGRLNIQKGYDILLEVCNLLNAQGYEYDVWIIGGGEEWNHYEVQHDLENQIYKYKLDNVYLIGQRDNPYPYVKAGDVFLSSSRYEGYSYVSQEAAILDKPLLLTDCAGVAELSKEVGGVMIVQNSYKGIYQGMVEAINDCHFIDKCLADRKRKDSKYYWTSRLDAIEKLILN